MAAVRAPAGPAPRAAWSAAAGVHTLIVLPAILGVAFMTAANRPAPSPISLTPHPVAAMATAAPSQLMRLERRR